MIWFRIILAGSLAAVVFIANLVIVPLAALALWIAPKDDTDDMGV